MVVCRVDEQKGKARKRISHQPFTSHTKEKAQGMIPVSEQNKSTERKRVAPPLSRERKGDSHFCPAVEKQRT
jgi:hypothetical protein